MRVFNWYLCCVALTAFTSACTNKLSFSNRASHATVRQAGDIAAPERGPIALEWVPATFPQRVDVQGPSSAEGAATRAKIPTGVALATRFEEVLDVAVGVSRSSDRVLTISVVEARTEYEYAVGFILSRYIDTARCDFEAEFAIGETRWQQGFRAVAREADDGVTQGTALLERAWDDIALQVAGSVVSHLPTVMAYTGDTTPVPGPAPVDPQADPRLDALIDAWPQLSEPVKSRILGIVEGAALPGPE